jgi:hypothetical protein
VARGAGKQIQGIFVQENKSAALVNSSEDGNSSQNSLWREPGNPFHCSWEWHFRPMISHFAPLLYSWGRRLSANSDSFYPSAVNVAKHFDPDRTTVLSALEEMVSEDWAEVVHKEAGKPVTYRFIDHEEWARNHPGCCVEKDTMPWEGEGDPLGKQLYAISGGLAKFLPGQMKALRKSELPDVQIAAEFRIFLDRNPHKGRGWKSVFYRFHPYLLRLAKDLREAAAACASWPRMLPRWPRAGNTLLVD